jgi:tRNA threonylcarbamoyl adenosine modification protein YeaZ
VSVTLAIECSQRGGGVALRDISGLVHVAELTSESGVDDRLMTEIDHLFQMTNHVPAELSLLGVSIGPGGFTGLRVAVSTAKMLALTTGCAVVPVASAQVAAASRPHTQRVAVVLASRRGTAWLTRIEPNLDIIGTPGLVDTNTLGQAIEGCKVILADSHLSEDMAQIVAAQSLIREDPVFDPVKCLELAEAGLSRDQQVDPHCLEPLYPRIPEAVRLFDA